MVAGAWEALGSMVVGGAEPAPPGAAPPAVQAPASMAPAATSVRTRLAFIACPPCSWCDDGRTVGPVPPRAPSPPLRAAPHHLPARTLPPGVETATIARARSAAARAAGPRFLRSLPRGSP